MKKHDEFWHYIKNVLMYELSEIVRKSRKYTIEEIEEQACEWKYLDDDNSVWTTGCGQEYYFSEGLPKDSSYKYCTNCGKRIDYIKKEV